MKVCTLKLTRRLKSIQAGRVVVVTVVVVVSVVVIVTMVVAVIVVVDVVVIVVMIAIYYEMLCQCHTEHPFSSLATFVCGFFVLFLQLFF